MTPKERMLAAMCRREPDRVPTGEIGVDWTIVERALGRESFYRAKWKELTALWDGRREEVVASYKRDIVDIARAFEWDMAMLQALREYGTYPIRVPAAALG